MDLFQHIQQDKTNLLPMDGTVIYHGIIISQQEADEYFHKLLQEIEWRNDEAVIYGKKIFTKRMVAWYGQEPYSYTYSNSTKSALPWTPILLALKNKIEIETGATYNACLLNLYHNGEEGMAWHSDKEKDLKENASIASLSFGAERKFAFKHKVNKEVIQLILAHGSLLEMKNETQKHWLHRLPPTKKYFKERINLTFRTIEQ